MSFLSNKKEIKNQVLEEEISIETLLDQEIVDKPQILKNIATNRSQQYKTKQSGMPAFRTALDYIRIKRMEVVARHNTKISTLVENKKKLEDEIDNLRRQQNDIEEKKRQTVENLSKEVREKYQKKINSEENEIKNKKQEIELIEQEIEKLKNSDIQYNWSFELMIVTLLAVFLLVYLWLFYATATYSAFFKDVENLGTKIINTFLDPTAVSDAWKHGWGIGLFVTLFPCIFVALGYFSFNFDNSEENIKTENNNREYNNIIVKIIKGFIDFFQKNKFIKAVGILLTAFMYDVLIAYIIAEGVFKQNIGLDENTIFNWKICLKDPHFWLIIGAGFIAYIIFGGICNLASKKWGNFNLQKREIKKREKSKNSKEAQIYHIENVKIPKIIERRENEENNILTYRQIKIFDDEYQRKENSINDKIQAISIIENEINNIKNTDIPPREINIYNSYVEGWVVPIEDETYKADVHSFYEQFRKDHNMN